MTAVPDVLKTIAADAEGGDIVFATHSEIAWRVQRMLDGLRAEGEAEVLVHYTLSEDIRALKRVKDAMGRGKPLPMALREQGVAEIFGPGSSLKGISAWLEAQLDQREDEA